MNGRVENDLKIFNNIEKNIDNYPIFVIEWYYNLKANNISAMSCKDFLNKVKNFLSYISTDINNLSSNDITENMVVQYFISIQTKEKNGVISETSDSYRQCIWSCLNNFLNYLSEHNYIPVNYIEKANIKRPKNNDLKRINRNRKLLNDEDFRKIIDCINNGVGSKKAKTYQKNFKNRDLLIMMLFMMTGMRKTALMEINVNDFNVDKHTLTVTDKGHETHDYYITDEIIKIYNDWLIDRFFILALEENDALFISRDRTRMSGTAISKVVDKYAYVALGYHISPHKLRSGLASIMYDKTGDIEFVRRVIGHSQVSTTQRYIVTQNTEKEEAANIMKSLLG